MKLFQKISNLIYKHRHKNEPWLDYYSREERQIKFTKKSIYRFMKDSTSIDKNFVALNYFENRNFANDCAGRF